MITQIWFLNNSVTSSTSAPGLLSIENSFTLRDVVFLRNTIDYLVGRTSYTSAALTLTFVNCEFDKSSYSVKTASGSSAVRWTSFAARNSAPQPNHRVEPQHEAAVHPSPVPDAF
jgi:hypothetical protein